jgi:hypothetical protein
VVGSTLSKAPDLITCLLDEPLSDTSAQSNYDNEAKVKLLQSRYSNKDNITHKPLQIRYGEHLGINEARDEINIPHAWLQENNIELVEIINPTTSSTTLDVLYACDMILFITDDLTLATHSRSPHQLKVDATLRLLKYFAHKPATRVLVNHVTSHLFDNEEYVSGLRTAIGREAYSMLEKQMTLSSPSAGRLDGSVLTHSIFDAASRANDALRMALTEPKRGQSSSSNRDVVAASWSDFSTLYTTSGMVSVKSSMEHMPLYSAFKGTQEGQKVDHGAAVTQTTNFLIRHALDQALYGVSAEIDEIRQAQGAANVLRDEVEAYKQQAFSEIFSVTRTRESSKVHERAGDRSRSKVGVVRDSTGFVESTFASRLPWWRILWKVDDVRAETEAAVDRSFAKDVETQLTFETGKLLNIAERLEKRTSSIFKLLNPSSPTSYKPLDSLERDINTFQSAFQSPILLNELRQHSINNVEKSLRPDLLTYPIEKRRRQLLANGGPIDVLCLRAQRTVLATIFFVGSAGILSLVGALKGGPMGASIPDILAPLSMQATTAAGTFAFATLFSIWLLQSRWTRAKKRFWRDWERIADGLDSDLQVSTFQIYEWGA